MNEPRYVLVITDSRDYTVAEGPLTWSAVLSRCDELWASSAKAEKSVSIQIITHGVPVLRGNE